MFRPGRVLAALVVLGVMVSAASSAAGAAPTETYIVVLKPSANDVPTTAAGLARAHGGSVGFVYQHALRGFSLRVPAQAAAAIAGNPQVAYVEADQEFMNSAQSLPTGIQRISADENAGIDIDGTDDKRVDVDVAVIDTGIDLDHPDLNVVSSVNCVSFFATCGSGGDDGNGHGTHVAGTIGALDNGIGVVGVAPGARLWAVRVLNNNGTGSTSQIVAGMDWVTARAATIEVANMSLSGGASQTLDNAASSMAQAGVAVAVAAGNNDTNAASYSPARAANVLTVSAIADFDGEPGGLTPPPSSFCQDQDDTSADFSNWGSTIEVAAPGCRILSTYAGGGYAWINGTSMASPHVAGALALLGSQGFSRSLAGVTGLYSTVTSTGNLGWTDESGDGIQEPLLDVHTAAFAPRTVGSGDGNLPPTASFTYSCTNLSCSFNGSGSSDTDGTIASYSWNFGDGATASGASTPHTYANAGTYTVLLTVQDEDGASGSSSTSLTVTAPPPTMSVVLAGSSVSNGTRWTASVTIAVTANGSPAQGVGVTGAWSNGASGTSSCTTGSSGQCSVAKSGIRKNVGSVRFTVNAVGGNTTFSGTGTIVVARP